MQKTAAMYWSIFLRTAGGLALAVLVAAQGFDWASEHFVTNSETVAWSLLGATIAGLIAVGWAFASSPATTALGKALRQAVQVLLGLPIAGVAIDQFTNFTDLSKLIVPTISAVVLAFIVTLLANRVPAPAVTALNAPPPPTTGQDFVGVRKAA